MIVSQEFFDQFSKTVMDRDVDGFTALFDQPALVISPTRTQTMASAADARLLYQEFRAGIEFLDADAFILVAREASYLCSDLMNCTFDVHLMRRTERQAPSFTAAATLRQIDGDWKLSCMSTTMDVKAWAGRRSVPMETFAHPVSARVA